MACLNGHRKVVEFLVKAGSDIDHESKQGVTPIELAVTGAAGAATRV